MTKPKTTKALQTKATRHLATTNDDSLNSVANDIEGAASDLVNLTRVILNFKPDDNGDIADLPDVMQLLADYSFRIAVDLEHIAGRAFAIDKAARSNA